MAFFWIVTLLAACFGGFQLLYTWVAATSAPQQAAGAALAISVAVIPYIFTRCLEAIRESTWRDETVKHLIGLRDDFRKGAEAMEAQASRSPASNQIQAPLPVLSAAAVPEMGYCPGCRKLRGTNVPKCLYCGDVTPVPT